MTHAKIRLELFLSCTSIGGALLRGTISPFAVLSTQLAGSAALHEIGRTETCGATDCPAWFTPFEVEFMSSEADTASVTVEVYHRQQEGVESLSVHQLLGRARVRIENLLGAPGMHFLTPLANPLKEGEKAGILQVHAEHRSTCRDEIIELDFLATSLRKRDWGSKNVAQSFEIFRAHAHDDASGHIVWLPVYRSCRLRQASKDNSQVLEFSRVTLSTKHFCNGDEERRIRIVLHGRLQESGVKKFNPHAKAIDVGLGYVDVTLRDMCEVSPTQELFEIEMDQEERGRDPGSLSLLKAEPTDVGSHFVLQINHADSRKLSSNRSGSARDLKKKLSSRVKHLSQAPLSPRQSKSTGDPYVTGDPFVTTGGLTDPLMTTGGITSPTSVGSLFNDEGTAPQSEKPLSLQLSGMSGPCFENEPCSRNAQEEPLPNIS